MQYGHHEVVCDALTSAAAAGKDLVEAYAAFVQSFFYGTMGSHPSDYDTVFLSSPDVDPLSGARQWWYQTCAEFGWWQIAPTINPIRSTQVSLQSYQEGCARMFNITRQPDTLDTNTYFGGLDITKPGVTSNIFFTNGVEDPWKWASVLESETPTVNPAVVIDCNDCGHCQDLHTPDPSDDPALQAARQQVSAAVASWFSGP